MNKQDKILILDNCLSIEECNFLISCYKEVGPTHQWGSFFPMSVSPSYEKLSKHYDAICNLAKKICVQVDNMVGGTIAIDWCEIVFWPMGSYMDPHFDGASADTVFTSITYLNNNFIGGNLYIENDGGFCVKTGRTLSFDGQYYKHGVSQVLSGERYTMPIWYKKKG